VPLIPPRSFIASAGMVCEPQIHAMARETVGAALAGHSDFALILHAAKEAGHVLQELHDQFLDRDEDKR
jgi:hypothetical protein